MSNIRLTERTRRVKRRTDARIEPEPLVETEEGLQRFDDDILSDLCQWRACVRRSVSLNKKRGAKRLCAWHVSITLRGARLY